MTAGQEEKMANIDQNDLIDAQSRGNTLMADGLKSIENTRKTPRRPACEVSVSFAAKPDETAIADVLRMLMNVGTGE